MTLVHDGETYFKTEVGSTFSIVLVITILAFLLVKVQTLVKQDQQQQYSHFSTDRDLYDPNQFINLHENNFKFAFGTLDGDIPPEIGRLVPYYYQNEWNDGVKSKKVRKIPN